MGGGRVIVGWLYNLTSPPEASLPFLVWRRYRDGEWPAVQRVVKESSGAKYPMLTRSNYTHGSLVMKVMLQARTSGTPSSMATPTSKKIAWPERSLSSQCCQR
jgi:hypothetical protein